eukprot:m.13748 g.13748  ORF g.13748 m.13748 type:complete len:244 (+) comp9834_c0_seq1:282-1013(+)
MKSVAVALSFMIFVGLACARPPSLRRTHTNHYIEVTCTTTAGPIEIEIYPHWSPLGATRFLHLVELGIFDNASFWRAVPRFVVQFGIPSTREKLKTINNLPRLEDEPNIGIPFTDGTLAFAGSGKNSRSDEVFFSLGYQRGLGRSPWETAFGRITRKSGLESLHHISTQYGDMPYFHGHGPDPSRVRSEGASYLGAEFPNLDYINVCQRSAECRRRDDGWAVCDCRNGFTGTHCHTPPIPPSV